MKYEGPDGRKYHEPTSRETVVCILADAILKLLMEPHDGRKRRRRCGIAVSEFIKQPKCKVGIRPVIGQN